LIGNQPPAQRTHSATLDALVAAGRTGVAAGGRSADTLFAARDRRLLALKRALSEIGTLQGT
jgi:3-hydroxybutyryl-CoA dehydrogenase